MVALRVSHTPAAAERGAQQETVEIIENRRRAMAQSGATQDCDAMITTLEIELRDMCITTTKKIS